MSELRGSLERSLESLRAFAKNPDDSNALRVARSELHQAHGALQLVDLEGVSLVTEEVEHLLEGFDAHPEQADERAVETVAGAFRAVIQYLEELLEGAPHQPVRLFPSYKSLLALRGADRIHPADLFYPDLSIRPPRSLIQGTPLSPEEVAQQRTIFERALLVYLRDDKNRDAAVQMQNAVERIEATPKQGQQRAFWWVTRAFFDALASEALPTDLNVKRLAARINLQIRRLLEGSGMVAERLLRDTLFFVARAKNATPHITQVKQVYGLHNSLPDDFEVERYSELNFVAVRAAKDALTSAKTAWSLVVAGDANQISAFSRDASAMLGAAGSLSRPGLAQVAQVVASIGTELSFDPRKPSEAVGLDVATALLFLEGALEQVRSLDETFDQRAQAVVSRVEASALGAAHPDEDPTWLDEISRQAQERLTMASFVAEMQSNLRNIEKILDNFFRDNSARQELPQAEKLLSQIGGALSVLGHEQAGAAIRAGQENIRRFSEPDFQPAGGEFERVAESLGAVGFYIESLQHRADSGAMFHFDEATGTFTADLKRPAAPAPEPAEEPDPDPNFPGPGGSSPHSGPESPSEETSVEENAARHGDVAAELVRSFWQDPSDAETKAELVSALQQVKQDALLLDDSSLKDKASAALKLLNDGIDASSSESLQTAVREIASQANRLAGHDVAKPAPAPKSAAIPIADTAVDAELLEIFLMEAEEVLGASGEGLAILKSQPNNREVLTDVRRAYHTLKGSGRMVGLNAFGEAGWAVEQTLNHWLSENKPANAAILGLIEFSNADLTEWVTEMKSTGQSQRQPHAVIAYAEAVREGRPAPAPVQDGAKASLEAATAESHAEPAEVAAESREPYPQYIATEIASFEHEEEPGDIDFVSQRGTDEKAAVTTADEHQWMSTEILPEEPVEKTEGSSDEVALDFPIFDQADVPAALEAHPEEQWVKTELAPSAADAAPAVSHAVQEGVDFPMFDEPAVAAAAPPAVEAHPDEQWMKTELAAEAAPIEALAAPSAEDSVDFPMFDEPVADVASPQAAEAHPDEQWMKTEVVPGAAEVASVDAHAAEQPIDFPMFGESGLQADPVALTPGEFAAAEMTTPGAVPADEPPALQVVQSDEALAPGAFDRAFAATEPFSGVVEVIEAVPPPDLSGGDIFAPENEQAAAEHTAAQDPAEHGLPEDLTNTYTTGSDVDYSFDITPADVPTPAPRANVLPFAPALNARNDEYKQIGRLTISVPLYNIYLTEADELLRVLTHDFGEWRHELSRNVSQAAVRAAHSLAGTSSTVGLTVVHDLAFALEAVLQILHRRPVPIQLTEVLVLEEGVESLRGMLHRFAAEIMPESDPITIARLYGLREEIRARHDPEQHPTAPPLDSMTRTNWTDGEELEEPRRESETAEEMVEPLFADSASASAPVEPEPTAEEPMPAMRAANLAHIEDATEASHAAPVESEHPVSDDAAAEPGVHAVPEVFGEAVVEPTYTDAGVDALSLEPEAAAGDGHHHGPHADVPIEAPAGFDEVYGAETPAMVDELAVGDEASPASVTAPAAKPMVEASEIVPERPAVLDDHMASAPTVSASGSLAANRSADRVRDEIDPELIEIFLQEASEYMPQISENLREWQALPSNLALAHSLMRQLHTVKGSARMAGAMRLGEVVHDMETRVESGVNLREIPPSLFDELLSMYDRASELYDGLMRPDQAAPEAPREEQASDVGVGVHAHDEAARPVPATPAVFTARPQIAPASQQVVQAVRVRADVLDRLVNQAGEVSISRSRLENEVQQIKGSLSDLTENLARLRTQLREIEIQAETQMQSQLSVQERERFDPLEFDRFTRLQELTRMMAESVSDVGTVQQNLVRSLDGASRDLSAQQRMTRDLQQDLMRVRMVPFSSVSERLYRVVRQSAKEVDKRVNLDIRGGGVEIDRSVLERMAAPFEHLLRNAVVHGIESRQDRGATSKSETGELLVEVRQEGNEIVLVFSDDGGGLNVDRIRDKARLAGLIGSDEEINDARVADLIFQPGFTTASEVTELAGRGFGMDVVRAEAGGLGGRVSVDSSPGKGTRFTINLPLTLAVTQVVLVTVASRTYAIPSVLVEQVQQLRPQPLAQAYNDGHVTWLNQPVPLYFLAGLLGERDRSPIAQRYSPLLILRSGGERVAVHVDEVVGNQEVVVKNIGPQLARMAGVAGATVLGSGDIVLILNPVQLAQQVERERAQAPLSEPSVGGAVAELIMQPPVANRAEPVAGLETLPTVMVVDDSLTVRRVTQRLLTREGYQVVLAKDGVDALQQLQDYTPDAMLVDIEMPRMDGFDLTRNVRGDERYHKIPIIMITSRTADKHREFARELGVDVYLGKPYQEDELLGHLARFTGSKRRATA
jgi:chemotaxis protein histidine kinase CheA/ActR/RegA family two-component response regulator